MGNNMLEPTWANPKGYFENRYFAVLNEHILMAAGGAWNYPPQRDAIVKVSDKFSATIQTLVRQEMTDIWGVKDPRFCLTYELYLPYFINPYFIICLRDYKDIAKSLLTRAKKHAHYVGNGEELAREYYARIDPIKLNYRNISIKYEGFLIDPKKQIRELLNFIKVDRDVETLAKFVDPSLNHGGSPTD